MLKALGALRKTNLALNGGRNEAEYIRLDTKKEVLAFVRKKGNDEVVFIANLSKESIKESIAIKDAYKGYFTKKHNHLI